MKNCRLVAFALLYLVLSAGREVRAELIAYWPLASSADDWLGSHGGSESGEVEYGVPDYSGQGFATKFGNGGGIVIPTDASVAPVDFSAVFWVRVEGEGDQTLLSNIDEAGASGYSISVASGAVRFRSGNGGTWHDLDGGLLGAGVWTHIVVSYESVADLKRIFVNGVSAGSATPDGMGASSERQLVIGGGSLEMAISELAIIGEASDESAAANIFANGPLVNLPVSTVTNLDDDGSGSLRAAITGVAPTGGRIVFGGSVFDEPTVIQLQSELGISGKLVVIDGSQNSGLVSLTNANGRGIKIESDGRLELKTMVVDRCGGSSLGFQPRLLGAGIYNAGKLRMVNSSITRNFTGQSASGGGGIYSEGEAILIGCIVSGNARTVEFYASGGGGIMNSNGRLYLSRCAVEQNQSGHGWVSLDGLAGEAGGGIFQVGLSSVARFRDCTISGNSAGAGGSSNWGSPGGAGGGLACLGGKMNIESCRIEGNSSGSGGYGSNAIIDPSIAGWAPSGSGAGIYVWGTDFTMDRCSVIGNSISGRSSESIAAAAGGGIYCASVVGAEAKITNSTFHGNAGGRGGAVYGRFVFLRHCTISQNSSVLGADVDFSSEETEVLANSIVAEDSVGGKVTVEGVCLLQEGGTWGGPGIVLVADPQLGPILGEDGDTVYRLLSETSPALATGLIDPGSGPFDQLGNMRSAAARVDIGAVSSGHVPVFVDSDSDGMDDRLEQLYGLEVGTDDAAGDSDGDGSANVDEINNFTDPSSPLSLLKIIDIDMVSADGPIILKWSAYPGLRYQLEGGADLENFSSVGEPAFATQFSLRESVEVPVAGGRFFRVRRID